MSNLFSVSGVIVNVRPNKDDTSALVVIQYGPPKEMNQTRSMEFVNSLIVRVPQSRYEHVKARLKDRAVISLTGHVQGILRRMAGEAHMGCELVADRILFKQWDAYAAARGEDQPKPVKFQIDRNGKDNDDNAKEEKATSAALSGVQDATEVLASEGSVRQEV